MASAKGDPNGSAGRAIAVTVVTLMVALVAVFAALNSYQVSRTYAAQYPDAYGAARAAARIAPLLAQVPVNAELGYITDVDPSQEAYSAAFLAAQYVVAPRTLIRLGAPKRPEWALGNFARPQDFTAAGAAQGYHLVTDFGNGVILYRRKS
jgi:hypothetical protein